MSLTVYTITIDCADPMLVATFWTAALGYSIAYADDDEVAIEPSDDAAPALLFIRTLDVRSDKNRIHLDLNPTNQEQEVERLLDLGATRADIGQRDVSWAVIRDPEGNEFCVLTPRE